MTATSLLRCLVIFSACLASALGGCGDEVGPTQLTARIYMASDVKARLSDLRVQFAVQDARGAWSSAAGRSFPATTIASLSPVDISFVPKEGELPRAVETVVDALDARGAVLVQQRAIVTLVKHQQRVLQLWLYPCGTQPLGSTCESASDCHGDSCQTCVNGACAATPRYRGEDLPTLDPKRKPVADKPPGSPLDDGSSTDGSQAVTCRTPGSGITCDDRNPCNGKETCEPDDPDAQPNGCLVVEPPRECPQGQVCSQQTGRCGSCEQLSDGDGDGSPSTSCGGDDCDDNDAQRAPGRAEICDGKDNDCSGVVDDGAANAHCMSMAPPGATASCELGRCVQRCIDPAQMLRDGVCGGSAPGCPTPDPCAPGGVCAAAGGTGMFMCMCGPGSVRAPDGLSCRVRAWSMPTPLETQPGNARSPRIALNRAGVGMAIWLHGEGTSRPDVWSRRYAAGMWEAPELVESDDGAPSQPDVAVDAMGNAYAVWARSVTLGQAVWGNRRGASWGVAGSINGAPSLEAINDLRVVAGEGPGALAFWTRESVLPTAATQLWADKLAATGALGAAVAVGEASPLNRFPSGALDRAGRGTLVWSSRTGLLRDQPQLLAAQAPAATWTSPPRRIDVPTAITSPSPSPATGVDDQGNALAVWTSSGLWWSRTGAAVDSWSPAALVAGSENAQSPALAVFPTGNAVVVWAAPSGGGHALFASSFVPATGWDAARRIDRNAAVVPSSVRIAAGPAGSAVAVWQEADGIWESRFAAPAWREATRIAPGEEPDVAMDDSGTALLVWQQAEGMRTNVMVSRLE